MKRRLPTRDAILIAVLWVLLLCPGLLWARNEIRYLRELEPESWD
jgi:hypothetical protein